MTGPFGNAASLQGIHLQEHAHHITAVVQWKMLITYMSHAYDEGAKVSKGAGLQSLRKACEHTRRAKGKHKPVRSAVYTITITLDRKFPWMLRLTLDLNANSFTLRHLVQT